MQVVHRQDLRRRARGNDAPVQQDADVRRPLRHGQVVRGEDDRLPGQPEIVQDLQHQGLRRRVDSGKWFVEEEDVGLLQECSRDEDPLLLPAGERPDLDGGEATHAHLGERCQGILAVPIGDGQEPAGAKRATHQGHVEHADRELPVDVRPLWHVGDAGTWAVDGLAVEEDLTMRRRQDAVQASQQRALAGAIGSDERGRLTGMEIEGDVFERGSILEVDAQAHRLHARHS